MALENVLERLIVAVEANTAALTGKPAAAPAKTEATSAKPSTAPKKTTAAPTEVGITQDELKAAASKVMAKHGKPFAKKLIKDVGGADNLPGVTKEKFVTLMKAFEKALTPAADEDEDTDAADEDDDL